MLWYHPLGPHATNTATQWEDLGKKPNCLRHYDTLLSSLVTYSTSLTSFQTSLAPLHAHALKLKPSK